MGRAEGLSAEALEPAYRALARTIASSPLPESSYYTAAEAAVTALYLLHPAPQARFQCSIFQLLLAGCVHYVYSWSVWLAARPRVASSSTDRAEFSIPCPRILQGICGALLTSMSRRLCGSAALSGPVSSEADGGPDTASAMNVSDGAGAAAAAGAGSGQASAAQLSRFLFVLGHTALQHLVCPSGVFPASAATATDPVEWPPQPFLLWATSWWA